MILSVFENRLRAGSV